MKWLNNLKVGEKLTLLIVCSLIGLFAVGGTGYYYLLSSNKSLDYMYNERLMSSEWLNEVRIQEVSISSDIYRLMATSDKNENTSLSKDIDTHVKAFNDYLNKYKNIDLDSFEINKVKELDENISKYRDTRTKVIDLAFENKNEEAYAEYRKNADSYAQAVLNNLSELGEHNQQIAEQINNDNKSNFTKAIIIFVSIILVVSILIVLLGSLIRKRIVKRLNDFVIFMDKLAQGDFSTQVPKENCQDKSEFGLVSNSIEKMRNKINNLIKQLSNTAEHLLVSSEELTASSEQSAEASNVVATSVTTMADGADKQVSFANDTTKVVENISGKINIVSENANAVSKLANKADTSAIEGEEAVEKAINQMEVIEEKTNKTVSIITELEEKSIKIGQIVYTIESISEQTNLLALNAAIESARAGEAGRGFSVVAEEIRKLAEQSQQSTKEIADIINEVQTKTNVAVLVMNENSKEVGTGAEVVNIAGISFREILKMIKKISEQIHDISRLINDIKMEAKASVTSVNNIQDISVKIADEAQTISAAAEEQLASVEEIASSSKLLDEMSEELKNVIHKFKI